MSIFTRLSKEELIRLPKEELIRTIEFLEGAVIAKNTELQNLQESMLQTGQ